jgi:hypothetical protein
LRCSMIPKVSSLRSLHMLKHRYWRCSRQIVLRQTLVLDIGWLNRWAMLSSVLYDLVLGRAVKRFRCLCPSNRWFHWWIQIAEGYAWRSYGMRAMLVSSITRRKRTTYLVAPQANSLSDSEILPFRFVALEWEVEFVLLQQTAVNIDCFHSQRKCPLQAKLNKVPTRQMTRHRVSCLSGFRQRVCFT